MSAQEAESHHHVVPPDELKCVWMTAGILSYQLCERKFDCEHCPLDQAMRSHFRREEGTPAIPGDAATRPPRPEPLRHDRRYSHRHCWVMPLGPAGRDGPRVRAGLEPGLAAALSAPRAVVHAALGSPVRRGEPHLWIVTEGGTFGVAAPMSGTLDHANALLIERPHLLTSRPMDEGWLFELRVRDESPEFGALLDARAAERAFTGDRERFRAAIRAALGAEGAAPPFQDGGAMLRSLADMLGLTRYFGLLRSVYG